MACICSAWPAIVGSASVPGSLSRSFFAPPPPERPEEDRDSHGRKEACATYTTACALRPSAKNLCVRAETLLGLTGACRVLGGPAEGRVAPAGAGGADEADALDGLRCVACFCSLACADLTATVPLPVCFAPDSHVGSLHVLIQAPRRAENARPIRGSAMQRPRHAAHAGSPRMRGHRARAARGVLPSDADLPSKRRARRSCAALHCTDKGRVRKRVRTLFLPSPRTPRPPAPLQRCTPGAGEGLRMPSDSHPALRSRSAPPVRGAFARRKEVRTECWTWSSLTPCALALPSRPPLRRHTSPPPVCIRTGSGDATPSESCLAHP
ncbi:hypothetical protein B0H17DRAFT_1331437 [Mycena rosella]|uniref:Uncharacterized protein n=1 Tax=Mycena rosella TaxID=1033263 RepID=A0AAD7DFD2_MYCRO|nr:hypothetical protein B0H17DRAFT_1331437 [Mycena rosella]